AVDLNESRLALANRLGAEVAHDPEDAANLINEMTDGRGADAVLELVGLPEAQALAYRLIRPGGTMSVIGCHCTPHFSFSPADAYNKNLTYRTGRCPARSLMPELVQTWDANPLDLSWCVTHQFEVQQAARAYDVFAHGKDGCVKAILKF
ncbi:MAG: zinc-binding dehydrogenase, partial [Pirellulales bacterium]|nr:zinc-binding dehydrogenase [Pirellulales bacterium]